MPVCLRACVRACVPACTHMRACLRACSMRHTREFMDFMAANDLTWEMYPLKNVTSIKHVRRLYGCHHHACMPQPACLHACPLLCVFCSLHARMVDE